MTVDLKTELNAALDWRRAELGNSEIAVANDLAVSDTTLWRIRNLMIGKTCLGILRTMVDYYNRSDKSRPTN